MSLYKIQEFYPNYKEEIFDGDDIKGLDVHTGETGEKIGTIDNALVDDSGRIRYFVIDTGFWIFGKKVLLPVGYCQIDDRAKRIYAIGILNKKQVEELPEYHENTRIDRRYEERVREGYLNPAVKKEVTQNTYMAPLETSAPLDMDNFNISSNYSERGQHPQEDDVYNYQGEPAVYDLNSRDHQTLKLYEEKLIANKKRFQTGEVVVSKHVETETARVSLPLKKERVVIERITPVDETTVSPRPTDFLEGEITRMKTYEEKADIHKGAFLREEVRISKEVEQNLVEAQETLRREELDVDAQGQRVIER